MKIVLQRVSQAAVRIDGTVAGEIGAGLMILLCAERGDTEADADFFAQKIAKLRLFADADGKTNLSILQTGGAALVVSQFTLAADWRRGNRPGFSNAEEPARAKALYEHFTAALRTAGVPVETGVFAAEMQVALINDGPFTLILDSRDA